MGSNGEIQGNGLDKSGTRGCRQPAREQMDRKGAAGLWPALRIVKEGTEFGDRVWSGSGAKASVAGASRTEMVREQVCVPPDLPFMVVLPGLAWMDGPKTEAPLYTQRLAWSVVPRQVGSALFESVS